MVSAAALTAEPVEAEALPVLPIALVDALRAVLTAAELVLEDVFEASKILDLFGEVCVSDMETALTCVIAVAGTLASLATTVPDGALLVAVPLAVPPIVLI